MELPGSSEAGGDKSEIELEGLGWDLGGRMGVAFPGWVTGFVLCTLRARGTPIFFSC